MPDLTFHFDPPVIAHRGVRAEAPENTLAAFRQTLQHGVHWIETDVKLTHDGVPILFHDDTPDRTTNGQGAVADTSWADMQNLDAGSWFNPSFANEHVPLLSEALRFVLDNKLRINLELKPCLGRTQVTVMVSMIEAAKIWTPEYDPPLISSFDIDALTIAARMHPDWPRGLLLDAWQDNWAELAQAVDASTVNINADALTADRVEKLAESKLPILAYTVNDPLQAKELLHWGVTAVFSDNPKDIIKSL